MASGHITSWQIKGEKVGTVNLFYFLGLQKSLQIVTAAKKLKDTCSLGKTLTNLDNILKSRGITLLYSQSYGFTSSLEQM